METPEVHGVSWVSPRCVSAAADDFRLRGEAADLRGLSNIYRFTMWVWVCVCTTPTGGTVIGPDGEN